MSCLIFNKFYNLLQIKSKDGNYFIGGKGLEDLFHCSIYKEYSVVYITFKCFLIMLLKDRRLESMQQSKAFPAKKNKKSYAVGEILVGEIFLNI